ncbi:YsnF/AvaK domain-containing protein [Bacillus sp. V5-8f]|uniref:YsnF/AvaK domain-containing protein n=1 Tax=Bacillus sp. V5-8f TaxID=2053044 RepID=UPI000C78EEE2|nr:YsnF/AvaK domain-containing protein [Bacillus sp. V5-8f]PLT32327.1 hypothetical protein CUU64_19715 [Bacillus sp. V5-8f]
MEKTVYGVFDSTPEVIQAINALKAKGYEGNDITVIADREEKLEFADYTDTKDVNTVANTPQDESFMDKVMRFFMNEGTYGLEDRLSAAGLSDTETAGYVNDVENGKILVLLDSEKEENVREQMFEGDLERDQLRTERMDVTGLNSGIAGVSTSGVTNNPDPNIFPDGTAGVQETTGDLVSGTNAGHLSTGRLDNDLAYADRDNERYSTLETGTADEMLTDEEKTLRLREEQLEIDKQEVQSGEVVINKEVKEEQRTVNVPVEHEEVYVERRPVRDRELDAKDAGPITDGETIRIPVVEEQVEVTKRPVVTDEVVIGKRTVQETQKVQDTIRKEEVQLDKDGNPLVHDDQLKNRIDTDKL